MLWYCTIRGGPPLGERDHAIAGPLISPSLRWLRNTFYPGVLHNTSNTADRAAINLELSTTSSLNWESCSVRLDPKHQT